MFSFIFNIPYTIVGLFFALLSIPFGLEFKINPIAFVIHIKKFWWTFGYFNNARAMAIGHVVLLGPNILEKDLEHELVHIEQYARMPLVFPVLYYLELFRKGYKNNKYEIEAYQKAGNVYIENGINTRFSRSAGGVVSNSEGRVLVVSQAGKTWSLPKGHIDEGEEAFDTAKREIYEESGVKQIEFIKSLGNYDRYKIGEYGGDGLSELKNISMFLFKTDEQDLKPIDSYHPEARWVEKEKVADLLTHKKDKEFFLNILKEL